MDSTIPDSDLVGGAVLIRAVGLNEGGPVLLHAGLDQVGRHQLADEVHQSVRGGHVPGVQGLVALTMSLFKCDVMLQSRINK